ncbi:MAG: glycosyltransferase family 4 protein [Rhodomicrobium sp.]|nr:glycosyltransferase family 4 protein [Rhodomicrobium sp.]
MMDHFSGHPVVTAEHVTAFVQSRDPLTQLVKPPHSELIFLHTVPNTTDATPWLIHIELPVNLFMPMVWQGKTANLKLRSLPVYWLVRYMLEQPECRGVFTHLKQTADCLGPLFESETIAAKTHYIPLGVAVTPEQEAEIERAIAGRSQDEVTVLFTNSFHQLPDNFVLRGGVDVVTAFIAASRRAENLRLILRTSLPDMLGPNLRQIIATHPKIEFVPDKISDEELLKLYCRSQIFVLPSAALHALSVARAMHCGVVCIASDAPGFEEYITDEATGFRLEGRRAAIYSEEPETGWLRDDYSAMFKPNAEFSARLAMLLTRLAQSEPLRREIGMNARGWAREHLTQTGWSAGFAQLLAQIGR